MTPTEVQLQHIKKWYRMSPVERAIDSLIKKKIRREKAIVRMMKEIEEIKKALTALGVKV